MSYTQMKSKLGNLAKLAPQIWGSKTVLKQINLNSLSDGDSLKDVDIQHTQKPSFELICVYLLVFFTLFFTPLWPLTLEEKVGQILMVHFHGEDAEEEAKMLIQDLHIGGFIYYNWSNGLTSPTQIKNLSQHLQALSSIPLLLATDQEGGIVARLTEGFTLFPGNWALGRTSNPLLAKESAYIIGKEMQSVGINMNLAPVVDINSNPLNPVIGIRSFGNQAPHVVSFGEKALEGYKNSQIITCLKHFPGHGDVAVDSHYALPTLNKSKEDLYHTEWVPFKILHSQADTIMTAHLLLPAIDSHNCATLSKPILDLLRQEIGFKGVIISDSLVMEGVLKTRTSIDEVAIDALNAGCDILLLGGRHLSKDSSNELTPKDIKRIHASIVQGVKTGKIPETRLNEAVDRILALKKKKLNSRLVGRDYPLNTKESQSLARTIAASALEWIGKKPAVLNQKTVVIAPLLMKDLLGKSPFAKLPSLFFTALSPSEAELHAILDLEAKGNHLLFFSYNAKTNPGQLQALQSLCHPFILVALRNPEEISLFPQASLLINTFSPSLPSLQALSEELFSISEEEAEEIGNKIFHNECGNNVENLTFWSPKEEFPSLGIGHFIWYPQNKEASFEETFPLLIDFFLAHEVALPSWLSQEKACPWTCRDFFYADIHSTKMVELRNLLLKTKNLQTLFMAKRLKETLPQILQELPVDKRDSAEKHFNNLLQTPHGMYALIDYLNFKGSGLLKAERYQGRGWGLAQVLQAMPEECLEPLAAFAKAARDVLIERVKNAPPERQEDRWLRGWLSRVETYHLTN